MGLFTRRRPAATRGGWTPLRRTSIPLTGPDADMGDDGQVFESAHMVAFGMQHPEGAVITVCTYAAFAEDEQYTAGLRYQYTSEAYPSWSYTGWAPSPWDTAYFEAGRADSMARDLADLLASGTEDLAAWYPQIFDWDGSVFATTEARGA